MEACRFCEELFWNSFLYRRVNIVACRNCVDALDGLAECRHLATENDPWEPIVDVEYLYIVG